MLLLVLTARWLVIISLIFWLLLYWRGGRNILADILRAFRNSHAHLDAALLMTMTVCAFVITAAGVLVCFEHITVDRALEDIAFIGTIFVFVGIFGTCYFRHYLGRFWAARTKIDKGHRIIEKGPYAVVRHPIYTAAILMYSGLAMVFPVWWNLFAVFLMNVCYVLKTQDEDKYLQQHLTGYHEYAQRVQYRLVPGIW